MTDRPIRREAGPEGPSKEAPDLVEWLTAQLDDDEQLAKAGSCCHAGYCDFCTDGSGIRFAEVFDDAHVLRQVAASRRILAEVCGWGHEEADDRFNSCAAPDGGRCSCFLAERRAAILGPLASIYSDRPGYDPSWTAE